jgi:antitoxin (DNA-binding transcriptional repressor) of toxin-antitoxin stability system
MTITVHQAKTHLSQFLKQIESGEEIVICRGVHPVARLVPFGLAKGQRPKVGAITSEPVYMKLGVFDPLNEEEIKEWGID